MSPLSSVSEPNSFTYNPGDVIAGKYALEQLLGTGGMGAVFRARNLAIDMPVALKLIRADLDRELLSGRLLQEARAAAKLAHPAIVRVFDVGKTALGDPFIVMELLQGESLADVLEREGRLSGVRAVQLLLPIADALSVAHAKGFVHRDVKPDNVFIANDQEGQLQPKLVDFGIVKHERQEGDSKLTQVGSVLGSPDYMSPEQARGLETIDQRSDVWSFSVVLYETIAGVAPFEAENYNALLRLIVETEPISLRDQCAADAELSDLVACGLSKEPAQRFASMGLMGKAMATWLSAQGVTEDACGVSLEARWLSRPTDPTALGRPLRASSSPDSWPEPPSGVRGVSSSLGLAPTVAVARQSVTPYSTTNAPPSLSAQKQRFYLGIAGLAILAAVLLGWLGATHPEAPREERNAAAPAVAPVVREPTAVAEPASAPRAAAPNVSAVPTRLDPVRPPKAAPPTSAVPTGKGVAAATDGKAQPHPPEVQPAAPSSPATPKSDLLSPY
jgi:eukaryotic-like serine/threonine-protein kinase